MKRLRITAVVVVLLLSTLVFVSAAGRQEVGLEERPRTLQVATVDAIGSLRNLMGNYLVDYIKGLDDAAGLTVVHIEGPVLGNAGQVMDQVAEGTVSIIGTDLAWVTPFDKDLQPTSFGFMFRSADHFLSYFSSPIFEEVSDRIASNRGLRVVSATPLPTRMFFSREPINTINDLRGLKVRAPGLEMFIESYRAYGASPTPISWDETFLALRTGVVDAAQGLPTDVKANNWHLAARHITKLNDMYAAHAWVMNEDTWNSLSERQRDILAEGLRRANAWALEKAFAEEEEVIDALVAEGAIFNDNFQDFDRLRTMALEHAMRLENSGKWSAGMVKQIDNIR